VTVTNLSAPPEPPPAGVSGEGAAPAEVGSADGRGAAGAGGAGFKVDPEYPEGARRSGVEGTVILDASIARPAGHAIAVEQAAARVSEAAVAAVPGNTIP
jgi:hypothetical protein